MPRSLSRQMRAAIAYVMLNPGCSIKAVSHACYTVKPSGIYTSGRRAIRALVKRGFLVRSGRMLFDPAFYAAIPRPEPAPDGTFGLAPIKAEGTFLRYD